MPRSQPAPPAMRFDNTARMLVLAYVLLDASTSWTKSAGPAPGWSWVLPLIPLLGTTVALWWPITGFALACVLMAIEAAFPGTISWLAPWLVATVSVASTAHIGVVAAVLTVGLVEMAALQVTTGEPYLPAGLVLLCLAAGLGLVIRVLRRRQEKRVRQLAVLHRSVAQVREGERRQLAAELSTQLRAAFRETDALLAASRHLDNPGDLRRQLTAVGEATRASLVQLRRLVGTLRRTDPSPKSEASSDLRLLLDDVEDELAVHAFVVETSLSGPNALSKAEHDAVARCLLLASDHVRLHAPPGSECEFAISTSDEGSTLSVTHELDALAPIDERLTASWRALEQYGEFTITRTPDEWNLQAVFPRISGPERNRRVERTWPGLSHALGLDRTITLVRLGSLLAAVWALWWTLRGADPVRFGLIAGLALAIAALTWRLEWALALTSIVLAVATVAPLQPSDRYLVPIASMAMLTLVSLWRPRWLLPVALLNAVALAARPEIGGIPGILYLPMVLTGVLLGLTSHQLKLAQRRHRTALRKVEQERLAARIAERQALARDLHDVVAHQLSLMSLGVERLPQDASFDELREARDNLEFRQREALKELQSLLQLMGETQDDEADRPEEIPDPAELASNLATTLRSANHPVTLSVDPATRSADPSTRRGLNRILQEAGTNIMRYSATGAPCSINVSINDNLLEARVTNTPADPPRTHPDSTGFGLLGLRERVALTGGTLSAGPDEDLWVLYAALPLEVMPPLTDSAPQPLSVS